jgi:diaminopimelate epimerase
MNFYKYEASGNDFIILNRPYEDAKHSQTWVKHLCARHTGIGADGMFFLWEIDGAWKWKFFNNDGSPAKFCGNAARSVVLWLHQRIDPTRKEWQWSDEEQQFVGTIEDNKGSKKIEVTWPKSRLKTLEFKSHYQQMVKPLQEIGLESALWVSAGVPHLVLIGSSWPRKIRNLFYQNHLVHHPEFVKDSNITWLSRTDMAIVSFERGVEAETLSCGSGALAAFYSLKLRSQEDKNLKIPTELKLQFPGGTLTVRESADGLHLSGPVKKVFEGYYEET